MSIQSEFEEIQKIDLIMGDIDSALLPIEFWPVLWMPGCNLSEFTMKDLHKRTPHPMPVWTFLLVWRPALQHLHFRGCRLHGWVEGQELSCQGIDWSSPSSFSQLPRHKHKRLLQCHRHFHNWADKNISHLALLLPTFHFQTHVSSIDVQVFPFASKLQPPWPSLSKRWIALWRFHLDWTARIGLNGLWPHTSVRDRNNTCRVLGLERKSRSQLSKFSGLESFGIHGLEFHFCLVRKTAKKHLVLNGEEFYVRLSHKIKLVQSLASGFWWHPGQQSVF